MRDDRVGWDASICRSTDDVAGYLVKVDGGWGVGLELARGDIKQGRGRTPWELLEAASHGDRRAERLWYEYERTTRGRQLMLVGRKLTERFHVEDLSDDEAAHEEAPQKPALVIVLEQRAWRRMLRAGDVGRWLVLASELLEGVKPPDWWWDAVDRVDFAAEPATGPPAAA